MTRALTQQERHDFQRAQLVLLEQQAAQERLQVEPEQQEEWQNKQVQMRLTQWIIKTGLETGQADFDLLDAICEKE